MTNDDELYRAIEMYTAARDVSIAAALAYNKSQIALDVAWRHKLAIQESRKPKE